MYVCGDVFECFRRNTLVKCGDEPMVEFAMGLDINW